MRLADLPKITVLEIWLLQVSKELSLGWGQLWGASRSQRIWLLITGNRRWTFAGQVGCPLTQLSYSRCRYSEWTHTGSHRKSRLTWDMAHPWTIITWKVSEDCCLGKAGVSVPPLMFLAVTHKPIKAQFSTYWPLFHNVLSNSQMSLLTCGLSPFVWTPAPLSEPWYILILMSAPGPAHLDSPRVGLTLSVLISYPLCSYMSHSLWPHKSQHARPACPSPTPGVHSDSCPSSQWCHPAISSSVAPFSSCAQSLPASESFPISQLFAWGGQTLEFSFSMILSKEIPGLISFRMDWLHLLAVQGTQESSPTPQFKSINSSALSFLHSPTLTSIHDHWKNHSLD